MSEAQQSTLSKIRWAGLLVAPVLALLTYFVLVPDESGAEGALTEHGRRVAAVAVLMAVWWLTEALPLAATALVPVAVMPLLGVVGIKEIAAPYASDIIFLFAGGLLLGIAMERWGLHRRIALITISIVGTKPVMLVGGFMLATALMSMWVSNTATAVMMLPIAVSVIKLVFTRLGSGEAMTSGGALYDVRPDEPGRNFALCLLLGVAYAASIGGVGTLIGTPPNALLAGFARETEGINISFAQWMKIGVPVVVLFLPLAWLILTRVLFPIRIEEIPGGRAFIQSERRGLGPMKAGEWATFIVFCCAALLWVREPVLQVMGLAIDLEGTWIARGAARLSDAGIAIIAALALFIIPVDLKRREFVLDWESASRMPFEILVLFGGGLALATAISSTGLDAYIGSGFEHLKGVNILVMVVIVCAVMIFLTELTSNTAVTATFLPILHAAALKLQIHPFLLLVPATIAASCGFMLPMGTPPNALVFATGHVTIPQMAKAGLLLNITGVVLISLLFYFAGGWLMGLDFSVMPSIPSGK